MLKLSYFNFSTNKVSARNEFKMYSTTKHGRVHLSNIKVSEKQHSKYLWRIHSLPTLSGEYFEQHSSLPNCATKLTGFTSVNTTVKAAAYFALFGLMGFSIVWLFLILCLVYESYCPS